MKSAALAAIVSSLGACATMMDGTTQQITVQSVPAGAKVFVTTRKNGALGNKIEAGVTPVTVTVSRKHGAILVEKDGFQSTEVQLKRSMNNWVWGDIVLTSLLSTSIDTSTGASNEFDPNEYVVELKPMEAQPAAEQPAADAPAAQ